MVSFKFSLLAVPSVWCQVLPRQTNLPAEFSNSSTSSPSTTTTAAASAVTEPPPCCFLVGGTFAVGVNRWWSTSVEEVVATVITNFARYDDNSTKVLNSTTLYKDANQTFPASSFGQYRADTLHWQPVTSPFVIPTDILTGAAAGLTGAGDYAATAIDNRTFATWDFTDLTIASPTPFNEWMNVGIITFRPPVPTNITTPLTEYGGLCGYWSAYTKYSATQVGEIPTSSIYATTEFSFSEQPDHLWSSTATSTYTTTSTWNRPQYSTSYISTDAATFMPPDGVSASMLFQGPFPGGWNSAVMSSGYSDGGALKLGPYIQPLATELPDGQRTLPIPTEVFEWLAKNATIRSLFPYIEQCHTMPGVGQPTVHAPVNQLIATSSNFVQMGAASVATTTRKEPTTQEQPPTTTKATAETQPTPEDQPTTTTQLPPNLQPTTSEQPTRDAQPTTNAQPSKLSTVPHVTQNTPSTQATRQSNNDDQPAPTSAVGVVPVSDTPGANQDAETAAGDSAYASQNVGEIIASLLGQSGEDSTGSPTGGNSQIDQPGSPAVETDVESAPVTNVRVAPGAAETSPSSVTFGGQIVQSGSVVVVDGQTASLSDNNLVIASGTETRIEPVGVMNTLVAIFEEHTVQPGMPTVINGATVSIDGDDLIIASDKKTRTEPLAAMSTPPVIFQGQTVEHGEPTMINGATVSIDGDDLIIASGSSTRTSRLPDINSPPAIFEGQTIGRDTAIIINGATVSLSGSNFIVASNSQTWTEPVATPAATYAGQPVYSGIATVVDGETVSISGTDIVKVSSGTATQTRGLGDAIMSGIGGGSEAPSEISQEADTASESAAPAEQTGGAVGKPASELVYVVAVIGAMRLVA